MFGGLRRRFARFVQRFKSGELSLISDELWLTIPIEDSFPQKASAVDYCRQLVRPSAGSATL